MNTPRFFPRPALLLAGLLTTVGRLASDEAGDGEAASALPKPFDAARLSSLIENPPFTRSVNPSDSLVLSGLAFIDGKPVATLFNTETKESLVVSEIPNVKGWTLNEAPVTTDVTRAQAKISIGGEIVSIRYNRDALTPDKLRRDRGSSSSSPSSGGDSGYQRSRPEPTPEDRERWDRYRSLSDSARSRLREEMDRNRERLMNATPEERAAFMRNTFDRVAREDQSGGGSSSSSSSSRGYDRGDSGRSSSGGSSYGSGRSSYGGGSSGGSSRGSYGGGSDGRGPGPSR